MIRRRQSVTQVGDFIADMDNDFAYADSTAQGSAKKLPEMQIWSEARASFIAMEFANVERQNPQLQTERYTGGPCVAQS